MSVRVEGVLTYAMQDFVVISGVPGSGKSTLGRALATELGWPFLDKDDYLEGLFDQRGCSSLGQRQVLSRESDALFEGAARELDRAVLCSFWRHPESDSDSGTPSRWLRSPRIRVLEIVCACPSAIAAQRFLSRRSHPGHHYQVWTKQALVEQSERIRSLLPLGIGEVRAQDTSGALDMAALADAVRTWIATREVAATDD